MEAPKQPAPGHAIAPQRAQHVPVAARAARRQVRCPLCGAQTEVGGTEDGVQAEVVCAACGLKFPCAGPAKGTVTGEPVAAGQSRPSELDRWLSGDPIRRAPPTLRRQVLRFLRNRPYLAAITAAAILLVALFSAASAVGYVSARLRLDSVAQQRREAEEARRRAVSLAAEKERLAAESCKEAARAKSQRDQAEARLREAEERRRQAEADRLLAEQQGSDARHEARLALARQLADDAAQFLASHPHRTLLLAGESLRAELQEGIKPDRRTEQILRDAMALVGPPGLAGHRGAIQTVLVTPDGRRVITGGADRTLRVWGLSESGKGGKPIVLRGHTDAVTSAVLGPDGTRLISAGRDGKVVLWDLAAEDPSASLVLLRGRYGPINALALSPDGRWLLGGGAGRQDDQPGAATLWDLTANDPGGSAIALRGHAKPVLAAAISPDGRWAITAGEDKTIRLWRLGARWPAAEQVVLAGHEGAVAVLALSPDGRWLASGSHDATVRLWDLSSTDPAAGAIVLRGHQGWIDALAISADGKRLASGSFDNTVRVWNLAAGDPAADPQVLRGHTGRVHAVAFSPDGRWLVSGAADMTARLWDVEPDKQPPASAVVLRGHAGPVNCLAISPDSRWLVTGAGETFSESDNSARIWDLRLETLLDNARLTAAERLTAPQQRQLLLESARRSEAIH